MKPTPILILSDTPDRQGGLSRITRDLAGLLCQSPKWRVATLGRESAGSRRLPFQQYAIHQREGWPNSEWGASDLRRVWEDHAGKERGVVMTIWDLTRTIWLARPELACEDSDLRAWLAQDHFDLWGYVTLDATGPQDRLTSIQRDALLGYRRLLAYTKWGKGVIERTIGQVESERRGLDWLPHGLDLPKWPIRDRNEAKARLYPFLHEGEQLVGAIGTNQPRKDWGLAASTCQQLLVKHPRMKFWWHTDLMIRHWSIPALLTDFGLAGAVQVTTSITQEEMSWRLTACDLTLHPGLGEGFGYPIFESLASGTPVIHGWYAGGADVLEQCGWASGMLIEPQEYRLDGAHNQLRPVFSARTWADTAAGWMQCDPNTREQYRASVVHLAWENLWPLWLRWFEGGISAGVGQ